MVVIHWKAEGCAGCGTNCNMIMGKWYGGPEFMLASCCCEACKALVLVRQMFASQCHVYAWHESSGLLARIGLTWLQLEGNSLGHSCQLPAGPILELPVILCSDCWLPRFPKTSLAVTQRSGMHWNISKYQAAASNGCALRSNQIDLVPDVQVHRLTWRRASQQQAPPVADTADGSSLHAASSTQPL